MRKPTLDSIRQDFAVRRTLGGVALSAVGQHPFIINEVPELSSVVVEPRLCHLVGLGSGAVGHG